LSEGHWRRIERAWLARREWSCPFCYNHLGRDEVVISSCSHAFDRRCYQRWVKTGNREDICPICKSPCQVVSSTYIASAMRARATITIQAGVRGWRGRSLARGRRAIQSGHFLATAETMRQRSQQLSLDIVQNLDSLMCRCRAEANETDALLDALEAIRHIDWLAVIQRCRARYSEDSLMVCPICYEQAEVHGEHIALASDDAENSQSPGSPHEWSVLSCCAALIHTECIEAYESLGNDTFCPCCKKGYIPHSVDL